MGKDMCTDIRTGTCTDMCMDRCIGMCMDRCIGMCVGMGIDMCIGMHIDMCVNVCSCVPLCEMGESGDDVAPRTKTQYQQHSGSPP